MSQSDPIRCPRCGAVIELYGPRAGAFSKDRIRAHKDPREGRSCWAGGRRLGELEEAQRIHRERQQEAIQRAAENS